MKLTRWLALTLFLSAFLLFCCQPMVGKMMLPLLGGAASVWTTCVLFFQGMLLAGYLYAHALGRWVPLRYQIAVHVSLMVVAFLFLPITLAGITGLNASAFPVASQLLQLLRSVGAPFFVISATAPLLQNWFAGTTDPDARDPYFLYAASNAGSLLALVLYPFVIEPRLGVAAQSGWWSTAYGVLLFLFVVLAAMFVRAPARVETRETGPAPTASTRLFWLAASFVPSALLLAVTNHISVNLASVPFLWVAPLAVYLVTFILAFGRRVRVSADRISRVAPALLLLLVPIFAVGTVSNTSLFLALMEAHLMVLLVGGLLCHAALAERRPQASRLTEYYAWIALGGVLGGVFSALVAPAVFSTVLEYPILAATLAFFRKPPDRKRTAWDLIFPALLLVGLPVVWRGFQWMRMPIPPEHKGVALGMLFLMLIVFAFQRRRWLFAAEIAILILICALVFQPQTDDGERLYVARDFFGVKKVMFDAESNTRTLLHGDTMHGLEGQNPLRLGQPLAYYHPTGPLGDVMDLMKDRPDQRVGVVGLGAGSIAGYAQPNRHITFFEIDPQVESIAREFFSFLPRCGNQCNVVLGDGRLSLVNSPDRQFDLLVLDAFNSDSIPAHLVSREALAMYRLKLKSDGLLLFHVSNRYLRLEDLVASLVIDAGLPVLNRNDTDESEFGKSESLYIVAALKTESISPLAEKWHWTQSRRPDHFTTWTDDYSNLLGILRW